MNIRDLMATIDSLQEYDAPMVEEYTPIQQSVNPLVAAMRELQEEGILESINLNEGADGDHQTGGSLGLPFPGTYEQEYGNFKSKGQRRMTTLTTEALDSSYEFDKGTLDNRYYFETEDDILYKVIFQGKDLVEIVFYPELEGEEGDTKPTTELTGTGNSRKVFGTVVKIVQDYVASHKPSALYFTADSTEPSRVKLYNAMVAQADKALPDYTSSGNVDLGSGVAYMLKRKADKVNEALDSSYEYRNSKQNPGSVFYFDTEDGQEYKVEFNSTYSDQVDVAFAVRGQGDEHKFGLTGTGNSRKIFGTVVKIVKDYINKVNPEILSFSANNQEPSRVRLYKMLAGQANKELPNYNFADAFSGGGFTTYYLTRDNAKVPTSTKVKAKAGKALDKVFEETTTLTQLYGDNKPDRNDTIWDYGTMIWDDPFEIEIINPRKLDMYLCDQYNVEFIEDLFERMSEEQHEIVDNYINDPNLSNKIIVLDNGYIVDGNHRAIAAALTKRPIKYIDIGEEEEA